MIEKVRKLINEDERYKTIIKKVYENPYIEIKELTSSLTEGDLSFYETALEQLISGFILVELTSQAGSTAESRVPKKILIVNPEIADELDGIF